jgi:hypothetical protein
MPTYNSDYILGVGSEKDYYCDAEGRVNQDDTKYPNLCPEMDFFQGNKFDAMTAPKKCDKLTDKYYKNCDGYDTSTRQMNPVGQCAGLTETSSTNPFKNGLDVN